MEPDGKMKYMRGGTTRKFTISCCEAHFVGDLISVCGTVIWIGKRLRKSTCRARDGFTVYDATSFVTDRLRKANREFCNRFRRHDRSQLSEMSADAHIFGVEYFSFGLLRGRVVAFNLFVETKRSQVAHTRSSICPAKAKNSDSSWMKHILFQKQTPKWASTVTLVLNLFLSSADPREKNRKAFISIALTEKRSRSHLNICAARVACIWSRLTFSSNVFEMCPGRGDFYAQKC